VSTLTSLTCSDAGDQEEISATPAWHKLQTVAAYRATHQQTYETPPGCRDGEGCQRLRHESRRAIQSFYRFVVATVAHVRQVLGRPACTEERSSSTLCRILTSSRAPPDGPPARPLKGELPVQNFIAQYG